jgi:hypothetical protein
MKQSFGYLIYADSLKDAINVLEPFIIAGNNYNTAMFLVLGWLLVVSEAPFVNNNSLYLVYRTKKKQLEHSHVSIYFYSSCHLLWTSGDGYGVVWRRQGIFG